MKKTKTKNSLMLIAIGSSLMGIVGILHHFVEISDISFGLLMGVGIGLLITAILVSKPKSIF